MFSSHPRPGSALPPGGLGIAVALVVVLGSLAHAQLPQPARGPQTTAEARPVRAGLPSARSVIDRHVDAVGGRKAALSHSSTHARGTLAIPTAGVTGTFEMFAAEPDKSLLRLSLGGIGEIVEAFNGTHAWSVSPMTGPMLLEGAPLEDKRFDAAYRGELRYDDRYASVTTIEQTEFDGRPCYKLRLVRRTGGEDFEFFEVASGLKAGSVTTRATPMGTVTGTTFETDYRRFGRLLQPTTVRSQVGGLQQVITIGAVEYDSVPPAIFDMPAEIKALLR